MTDIEKFKKLLEEFGIPVGYSEDSYHDKDDECYEYSIEHITKTDDGENVNKICLSAIGDRIKVKGYSDFYSIWDFDENGKFKYVGMWE